MYKKLFILTLIGLISATSAYAKCDGGTEVTGKSGSFCVSNVSMNWWTAAAWCKANGMHLPTMYELCPSWDGNTGSEKCPELSGTGNVIVWTSTVAESMYAFNVELNSGYVHGAYGGDNRDHSRSQKGSRYAICR